MVYLDYNVIINVGKAKNKGFNSSFDYMRLNREKFCVSFVIIEEIVKSEKCNELIELVKEITSKCIWPSSNTGVEIKDISSIDQIVKNAMNYQTQDLVDANGELAHKVISQYRELNKINYSKEFGNINNLSRDELWSLKMVQDMMIAFQMDNVELKLLNFKEENVNKVSHVFTALKNVLNSCGYNFDTNIQTATSGIYDVTHMINARECSKFITCDKRLANRVDAIYYLLNIETEVVKMDDFAIQKNNETNKYDFKNEFQILDFLKTI
ncbi:MAG: hypothetical protein CVV56_08630 [Tenericutes bacterium HGW-Tenericutes-1]|nr:MAG: hypothetical protein CVV56_08630 [Tenericutes bacterium HGW-Tenericutes-1]